ncbi:hypothetical protein JANAI62_11320 [Jannaschia pagri]|uniref:EF-hand domain-containing protein n=1 Tax=Jannaschia pagri TaxID=2829797 RepID=A0ABQ4NJA1_9RHOB|nr:MULTISPECIES: EF-hand domain-containing protein [unclassified Jannaschia]GIT90677.1 hypothetical protein JANAI61_11350 [Jannaschia sp. AI_61]GIT94509.1 hypothetical protein JANAI62_11320 [Jannaschia sp. AI_62]
MTKTSIPVSVRQTLLLGLIGAGAVLSLSTVVEARGGPESARPTFEQIDANGDGAVTPDEVRIHMRTRGAERFAQIDTDGNGALSRAELAARAESRADRMLARLDTNTDGEISREELEAHRKDRGGRRGGRGGPDRLFERADADNNGSLSKAEWDAMPTRGARR